MIKVKVDSIRTNLYVDIDKFRIEIEDLLINENKFDIEKLKENVSKMSISQMLVERENLDKYKDKLIDENKSILNEKIDFIIQNGYLKIDEARVDELQNLINNNQFMKAEKNIAIINNEIENEKNIKEKQKKELDIKFFPENAKNKCIDFFTTFDDAIDKLLMVLNDNTMDANGWDREKNAINYLINTKPSFSLERAGLENECRKISSDEKVVKEYYSDIVDLINIIRDIEELTEYKLKYFDNYVFMDMNEFLDKHFELKEVLSEYQTLSKKIKDE